MHASQGSFLDAVARNRPTWTGGGPMTDPALPLEAQPWYHAEMAQADAVGMLRRRAPDGAFMVTPAERAHTMLCHVKNGLLVTTCALAVDWAIPRPRFRVNGGLRLFETVPDAIACYAREAVAQESTPNPFPCRLLTVVRSAAGQGMTNEGSAVASRANPL